MKIPTITVHLRTTMTLWDAIKLRIAGIRNVHYKDLKIKKSFKKGGKQC